MFILLLLLALTNPLSASSNKTIQKSDDQSIYNASQKRRSVTSFDQSKTWAPPLCREIKNLTPHSTQLNDYLEAIAHTATSSDTDFVTIREFLPLTQRLIHRINSRENITTRGHFSAFLEGIYKNDGQKLYDKTYDATMIKNAIYGVRSFMSFITYNTLKNAIQLPNPEQLKDFFQAVRSSPAYTLDSEKFMHWNEVLDTLQNRVYPLDSVVFSHFFEAPLRQGPPTPWKEADFDMLSFDVSHVPYTAKELSPIAIELQKQQLGALIPQYDQTCIGFIRGRHVYDQDYGMLTDTLKIFNQTGNLTKEAMDTVLLQVGLSATLYPQIKSLAESTLAVLPKDSLFSVTYGDRLNVLTKRTKVFSSFNDLYAAHTKNMDVLSLFHRMMENLDCSGAIQNQPIVKDFVKGIPIIFGDDDDLGPMIFKKLTRKVNELRYAVDKRKSEAWRHMYS